MRALLASALLAAWPLGAAAHSFGRPLTLPVPLWLYLYGSAAALVLSFGVLGWQGGRMVPAMGPATPAARPGSGVVAWVSVVLFALALAAAFLGSPNPYRNFSMTFFWIVFLLGGLYASALLGERVLVVNPWRALLLAMPAPVRDAPGRRCAPPAACAIPRMPCGTPALLLLFAWVAFELLGPGTPRSLGWALAAYTGVTLAGGWWCGGAAWLERGEVFHRLFSFAARLAPLDGQGRWRSPVPHLVQHHAAGPAALLFLLFLLSSTAFDALKETVAWNAWYWERIAPLLAPGLGDNLARAYPTLAKIQAVFNGALLLASPFVYLAACTLALLAMRAVLGLRLPLREQLLVLAPSLLPVAVAYHAAHYVTLLLGQGARVFALLADPFGLSTAPLPRLEPPSALATWHLQVALILAGHVLGMVVAHCALWQPAVSRARNGLAQLPLLVLMTALTASGLWVMAQPVSATRAL